MMAVIRAKRATYHRVARRVALSEPDPKATPTRSRCTVDARTSSTLSSDDMAAATMASRRNALVPAAKTSGAASSCGTTRSVSASPPGRTLRAYSPTGIRSEYTTMNAAVDTQTPFQIAALLSSA